jgi:hypothetical protein
MNTLHEGNTEYINITDIVHVFSTVKNGRPDRQ